MIDVKCDHCNKKIENPRTEINKNFIQVLDDDGKVEADLCKDCYGHWCKMLDGIDKEYDRIKNEKEIIFKLDFLQKVPHEK